jgi:hypothetical protein
MITTVFFDLHYSNFIHRLLMEGGCMGIMLGSIGPRSWSLCYSYLIHRLFDVLLEKKSSSVYVYSNT